MSHTQPNIWVLAGPNGGGKSSVGGASFRMAGVSYFNPDEATRRLLELNPATDLQTANGAAWRMGKEQLEKAIVSRSSFSFETTLGGTTIPRLLREAADAGLAIRMWFVALRDCELHLARIKARVSRGGHDIPEDKVRARYENSRKNLIALLPHLRELRLFDNSREGAPDLELEPEPTLILHLESGKVLEKCPAEEVPPWAEEIVAKAQEIGT